MGKMVVRLIPYRLLPAVAILLGVGAALAEGMQTFTNEQAAQRHCPADAVVWLNTSSANYHFRSDPWYGRTQRGAYVGKIEAEKHGMHPLDGQPHWREMTAMEQNRRIRPWAAQ